MILEEFVLSDIMIFFCWFIIKDVECCVDKRNKYE